MIAPLGSGKATRTRARTGGRRSALAVLLILVGAAMSGNAETSAAPGPAAADNPLARQLRRQTQRLAATRGKPEAAAALAAIAGLGDDLPPGEVEAVLRPLADDPATDPLVAAQATAMLGNLLDQRGAVDDAARQRAGLGLLSRFWVVGPFGDGRASFGQAFPPEAAGGVVDAAARFPGKEREVGWRSGVAAVRQGALLLDALLRPDSQAAAYAATVVRAPAARMAVLRVGSPGPIKIWVNGRQVLARDVVRTAALDQDAIAVNLRRGDNRILIKTVITEGAWRLLVRLTDAAGRTLLLPEVEPTGATAGTVGAVAVGPPVPASSSSSGSIRTLEKLLRARAVAAPTGAAGARAWLDLGRFLSWASPSDRDARDDVAALEQSMARRPTVEALAALAEVGRDDDERRRSLELAATLGAGAVEPDARADLSLILGQLGDVARAQHRDALALERWRQALLVDPTCWPATVALADEEQASGLAHAAVARLEALPVPLRAVRRVGLALVRHLGALDRTGEADALLAELQTTRRLDPEIAHQVASRARVRGDSAASIAPLRVVAAARPELPSLTIDVARALEGAGTGAEAVALLNELVVRLPDDAAAHAALAKLLLRLGQREPARAHLALAVALRPQDAPLRRYAERAAAQDQDRPDDGDAASDDLARRHAVDPLTLLPPPPAAGTSSTVAPAAALAADPATVLLDRRVVRVHRNGLSDTFAQRVVEIASDRGAEDNKEFLVRYTPGSEDVEIRQARIYRRQPGGEVQILQASDRDDRDLSEPWYGLYYDQRASVVRFEGLRAGDVLDIEYVVTDVAAQNELADYFGDLQFVAEAIPKRRWDYTLIGPAQRKFYTNTPQVASLTVSTSTDGDLRTMRFSAHDIAKIDSEPAMPGFAEVTPYLHVSTYASWADVGTWYWRLVADQLAADATLRQAARAAVARPMSDLEKVRAIHALVVTGTRYVGLEFGIHGFKPYKVTQVLARRFGDCKDKAALMVALLREVGVDAEMVLLRTRRAGRIDSQPASLAVFDHAIAFVPRLGLYLDGTAEFSGMDELPYQDQGVMGLRVSARGAVLVETPVLASGRNRAQRRWDLDVDATGNAQVREALTISGQAAAEWREHYQTPGERLDRYGKVWTARNPGAVLRAVDMPGLEDRSRAVTVHATASVPRFGLPAGPREVSLPIVATGGDFTRAYARLSTRKQDLVIAYPWQHEEELVFHLPAAARVQHLPAARAVNSDFGRFKLDVSADAGGVVRVRAALDVTRHRMTPAEYPRFREFLGEIDAALADRLVVRTDPS